jgi:hypothetical protein
LIISSFYSSYAKVELPDESKEEAHQKFYSAIMFVEVYRLELKAWSNQGEETKLTFKVFLKIQQYS